MQSIERTGENFNLEIYNSARDLCKQTVEKIASLVVPGISEPEGQNLISDEFKKVGVTKFWHPSKFRIGSDTMKSFRDLPDKEIRLQSGDIFFLDVGPIIQDHEADYGKTFVMNTLKDRDHLRYEKLIEATMRVWQDTADQWLKSRLTGRDLFDFADKVARSLGYDLNPMMAGHRLGDFPHALFSKEKLFGVNFVPKSNLWVLEIHLVGPDICRGAFFEDILSQ